MRSNTHIVCNRHINKMKETGLFALNLFTSNEKYIEWKKKEKKNKA